MVLNSRAFAFSEHEIQQEPAETCRKERPTEPKQLEVSSVLVRVATQVQVCWLGALGKSLKLVKLLDQFGSTGSTNCRERKGLPDSSTALCDSC